MNNWDSIILDGAWRLTLIHDADLRTMQQDVIQAVREENLPAIPATVPGNFELDLQAAGELPDVFFGDNILKLDAYEDCHLLYFRRFQFEAKEGTAPRLVFEGIDTYADVYVNGRLVYECDNMLIPHTVPVEWLADGEADIVVHIRPTLLEAKKHRPPLGAIPMKYNGSSLYVRKAPHMFGWDIAPRILSGGLWRPVKLEYCPQSHIEETYLVTKNIDLENRWAYVTLYYTFQYDKGELRDYTICCEGSCGDSSFAMSDTPWFHTGQLDSEVTKVHFWWPKGRGEQAMYDVTVTLKYRGETVDTRTFRAGLRTVDLINHPACAEYPEGEFDFRVNGESIFILGTDWVPADALHSRDSQRIPAMLDMVDEIGCNAVRCWGGNVYEDEQFFDICDEKGILVWQDFAMACSIYPQDEAMQEALRKEAICIVKKLRQHPSLLMWAGDNECDQSYILQTPRRDPNRNKLTRQVLPDVLFEHDYFRPYLPSSPYVDPVSYANRTQIPEDHLWGARQYFKVDYYSKTKARFVSEIGYHGCPSPASIKKYISADQLWPDITSRDWQLHATSPEGTTGGPYGYRNNLMKQQIMHLFGQEMETLEDFALASQLTQCEAMKFFVEMFRAQKGRRRGIIWWNLIDCWPQFSDAVVDYYYTRKLAYWTLQRSQWPVCLLISDAENGIPVLYGVNDTKDDCPVSFKVFDAGDGRKLVGEGTVTLGKDSSLALGEIQSTKEQTVFIIEYTVKGILYKNHFLAGKPTFDFQWFSKLMEQEDLLPLEGFEK